jgi:hypothetical protein
LGGCFGEVGVTLVVLFIVLIVLVLLVFVLLFTVLGDDTVLGLLLTELMLVIMVFIELIVLRVVVGGLIVFLLAALPTELVLFCGRCELTAVEFINIV